jgi:protein phosphatase
MSTLRIPELALVVLVGSSGSGKSTFGRKHFLPTEVLSSDYFRGLVSDNENEQSASRDAFEALHFIAGKRLRNGRLTVIDATNVQPEARKPLVELAREFDVLPVAIVLDLPERVCHERNRERPDRQFGPHVVRRQRDDLRRSLRGLEREGFRHVFVLSSLEEVEAVTIERQPLWTNRRSEHGPFDVIGDVHGCCDELELLLGKLGYQQDHAAGWRHPEGRKAVFLGDLVDRGPRVLDTLNLARRMVAAEAALCIPGNHDVKLHRWLRGKKVQITHGLEQSIQEIEALPEADAASVRKELDQFLDSLVSHYVLDDGKLVVAHAGMKAEYQGRASRRVRDFALYGETTGETDEFGLPVRYPWAQDYRGSAMVVYGHTPVPESEWLNRTLNVDTGCVFGGQLTALRYPELDLVSVPAAREYAAPIRPLRPELAADGRSAQQEHDDLLDLEDVSGKRIVNTRLRPNITIREENTIAALEVMSRFAANPKWLIYLPPTMSPSETSREPGLLEHPTEALAYFQSEGVARVVCEEKHMGSRAVVIVCRDAETARRRFGIAEAETGIVYTRTGRRFFDDLRLEAELLERVRTAFDNAGLWEELETDWVCLDCELMPWSAKAQALLIQQYAPVGAAATAALDATLQALAQAKARGGDVEDLLARHTERRMLAERYVASYRRYCWDVHSLADLRLAPFHILATEGKVPADRDHVWHMETLRRACEADPALLLATPYRVIDLADEASRASAVAWWTELTARGGEGMVVKPFDFVTQGRRGLVQPALKCRGSEYLRIIYGPEYTLPENLERLRQRGLGAKRSLAHREFALGIEGLERFVQREPLRRVHECVFAVLALESEPVDPRL